MAQKSDPTGLQTRLFAIAKLQAVLKGEPFTPIGAGTVADARDRAFANKLVTVALRRQGHINKIIAEVLARGLPPRSGSFEAILRIGLAELLFVPDQADHSALFLAVEAAKRDRRAQHLAKLLNGVLRRVQREAEQFAHLPSKDLFPDWLESRWRERYGAEAIDGFAEALLTGAPLDLTLRDDDAELILALHGERVTGDSIRIASRDKPVAELPGFSEGRWWVQDASSAIPARLMGLTEDSSVLDMCAAPGGKSAQLVKAGYQVTALDKDAERLERVAENLKRLGYDAAMVQGDGIEYRPDTLFDGVLVDAPCSATGTFRRHPEALWHRVKGDVVNRMRLQQKLLTNAVNCLNDDGVLIYSTCSLEQEEGEDQARWLLKSMSGMINFPIQADEVGGFEGAIDDDGWLRLHPGLVAPGTLGGTIDGFFVARFRRERVQR